MPVSKLFVHTATVQTFLGESGYSVPQYSAPVQKAGFLDGGVKLVRDRNGEQVVASATWFTSKADLAVYTLDSLVSVNNVTNRRVLGVEFHDSGSLGLPDHLAVYLV